MTYRITFDPAADSDLAELYDYIAERAGRKVARQYIEQILDHCAGFDAFPLRGMRTDELGHGIRIVGFKRKASIVFHVGDDTVTIMRILHRGKSLGDHHDPASDES